MLSRKTIRKVGLHVSRKLPDAHVSQNARVFEYPSLENVFIMESDLYGNIMPEDSCFLAFYGRYGFIGTVLKVETLQNYRVDDIKKIVERNLAA
jgi:hypothetical protein